MLKRSHSKTTKSQSNDIEFTQLDFSDNLQLSFGTHRKLENRFLLEF
ncbi:hypothetical protein LEP1GSC039_1549 [Leptospira santarosai str. 2000027870]|nr:hypothetical protein LEP1GSC039_1549 [Leptospira santarosai str. 2000027870]